MAKKIGKELKKFVSLLLAAVLLLTACGSDENAGIISNETAEQTSEPTLTYVKQDSVKLEGGGKNYFSSVRIVGDRIYSGIYSYDEESAASVESVYIFSLEGEFLGVEEFPLGETNDLTRWCVDGEENIYIAAKENTLASAQGTGNVSTGSSGPTRLYKFDSSGTLLYQQELPEFAGRTENSIFYDDMMADGEGHVYILFNEMIFLVDSEGNYDGSVTIGQDTPQSFMSGKEGEVYILCLVGNSGLSLVRADYDDKTTKTVFASLPEMNDSRIAICDKTSFLYQTRDGLYQYNGVTGQQSLLLNWQEQELLETGVRKLEMTEDGRIVLVATEGSGNNLSTLLVIFGLKSAGNGQQTAASPNLQQVDDRTVITLAGVQLSFEQEDLVHVFNQSNEQYRVEMLNYCPKGNPSEEEVNDARERMLMETALGTNDCDLILLDPMTAGTLSDQSVFEDLYPFLDASEVFDRGDFFSGVLDAYTVDDKLITIPYSVTVQMLVGREADFGEDTGWTLRQFLDYWKGYPGSRLFYTDYEYSVIQDLLDYGNDSFACVEDGEVVFDRETCRDLLELLKMQGTSPNAPYETTSIRQGETLMSDNTLYRWDSLQDERAQFDEPIVYVGFPNAEGETQFVYSSWGNEYAISVHSDCKEGAWAFLEFYLGREAYIDGIQEGMSSIRSRFEEWAEWKLYYQYARDREGNILLDEDGSPRLTSSHWGGEGEDFFAYSAVSEEDVDKIRELLDVGGCSETILFRKNNVLSQIVKEEGGAYFSGQKPLDVVVDIIENRLTLYLQEQQ